MITIDLNADMGEGAGDDAALLEIVTSANIACGGHAGDERSMAAAVRAAAARGVAIGAHPSYPDRANFGRVAMEMNAAELGECVWRQVAALDRIARGQGAALAHVKPHGALYHAAMNERGVACAIGAAVKRVSPNLVLVGLAGSRGLEWWREAGMPIAAEAFADRRYERDGSLRPRSRPGAMVETAAEAADQALGIACGRGVAAGDGVVVPVSAGTICIHGDNPGAVEIARAVRRALEAGGVVVRSPARQ